MSSNKKGCIQLYKGNDKGKSMPSIGLTLTALRTGLHVCYIQGTKAKHSSEVNLIRTLPESQSFYKVFGHDRFIIGTPAANDVIIAHEERLKRTTLQSNVTKIKYDYKQLFSGRKGIEN